MIGDKFILLAVLVVGWGRFCECQVIFGGECLDIEAVDDFDMKKFLGTWYEYKKYPTDLDKGSRCNRHLYSRLKDGNITILKSRYNIYSRSFIDQTGTVSDYHKGNVYLNFKDDAAALRNRFSVIDTDYKNYAVYYSCIPLNARMHIKMIEILTRDTEPTSETMMKSFQVFARNGLETSYLIDVEQKGCIRRKGVVEKVISYV